jgi:ABC-type antimicrobial peptide transport system permease subunit
MPEFEEEPERQIKSMVVFQGMRLALAGILVGVAAAFGLARFLEAFLFGVHNRDPLVFVCVPLLLGLVALLAAWLPPARRAGSIRSLPCGRSKGARGCGSGIAAG